MRFRMARIVSVDQLRKPQRTGHACGPTTDDDDVRRHFGVLDVGERLAEDECHGLMAERWTMNGKTPCNIGKRPVRSHEIAPVHGQRTREGIIDWMAVV